MSEYQYATTADAGMPAAREERENIVKEFEWATTELDKTVSELQQRLAPILRPDYDAEKVSGTSSPAPEVSAARSQLMNLHRQTSRVRYLLDRLEV